MTTTDDNRRALEAFKRVKVYIDESLRQAAPFLQNLIKKLKADVVRRCY